MFYIDRLTVLHLTVLTALCAILFFPHLARFPFFNKGEPREALVVQEIFQHESWLFPLKKGEEIPSKPPLFHWFAALTSIAWGQVTEATVRFPSALFATLTVVTLYILGRSLFDPKIGFLGGLILATSVGYQIQAISARVDMTLVFFMTLTLATFYLLYQNFVTGGLWTYGFYLLLGVSVLAKGPVGLVLPGMVILAFLGLRKRWDFLSRLCFHKGVVLTLTVGISWYAIALMRGGEDFFNRQVIHENLARFFVYGEGGSGHQKSIYYYFPYLILWGLPWSLFLPFVVVHWFRNKTFGQDHSLFLVLWAGLIFLFFSLSAGKRSVYLLPLYPPLSLLAARWFREVRDAGRMEAIGLRFVGGIFLLVCVALGAVLFDAFLGRGYFWFFSALAPMLNAKDQAELLLVQRVLEKQGWIFFSFLGASVFLWAFLTWDLFRARVGQGTVKLSLVSLLTWQLAQMTFLPSMAESRSYKAFMVEVNRRMVGSGSLYIYGEGWDYASVVFYRGDRIPILKGDPVALKEKLRESEDYYIMGEREWGKLAALGNFAFPPELTSTGTGPDGRDPIVLIRGLQGQKGE
jgi:4-amino-4-deoxy-L-arabinose transferase-like glycosyltransferase